MNFIGLAIGICTFLIIGLFHPIVIKFEYYFGVKIWWVFLLCGILFTVLSLFLSSTFWSVLAGVFAFSSFWSIKEIFEKRERGRKGWFPKNEKRKN